MKYFNINDFSLISENNNGWLKSSVPISNFWKWNGFLKKSACYKNGENEPVVWKDSQLSPKFT